MPLPSDGELKLWDDLWNQELAGSKGDNSLHSASVYAGFSTPDALSDFYGWSDVEVPSVTTQAMSSVNYNDMNANGNVTSTGNENPDRGFYFGRSAQRTSNTKYSVGTGGTGTFTRDMNSLSQLSNYYGWAYACNSAGEATGGRVQAQTTEQSYTVTSQTFTEGFYDVWGENGSGPHHTRAQLTWINPYSSNLNQFHTCTNNNGRIGFYDGCVVTNATNRWCLIANCSIEFWGDAGGNIQYPWHYSQGQVSFTTQQYSPVHLTGQFGIDSKGGYPGPAGGNSLLKWTHTPTTTHTNNHSHQFSDIRLKTSISYL